MNILYIFPRHLYESKMSIGRVLYGEALQATHGINLHWFGLGWPGYDWDCSLRQNIESLDFKPDALICYKAHQAGGPYTGDLPSLVIFNEANDIAQVKTEVTAANATIVGFHHSSDIARCESVLRTRNSFHLPHCALKDPLASRPIADRPIDCLVTGVLSPEIYPLRCRMASMMKSGNLRGKIRKHPGYRLQGHAAIRQQFEEYRSDLRNSKIVLACSSKYQYPLAKFQEAAMAGCVLVCDEPADKWFRDAYGDAPIWIKSTWSDDTIATKIQRALLDPKDLQQRATQMRLVAEQSFTLERYAERLKLELYKSAGIPLGCS